MRRAVLSDIHGNMDALARVFDDIDRSNVAEILCLGDSIGYGAEPETVVAALRARKIASVMGNHELGAVNPGRRRWFNPMARRALVQTLSMLSQQTLACLAGLPSFLVHDNARFVHGFPPDLITTYLFEASEAKLRQTLDRMAEPICFIGHTHIMELIAWDGRQLIRQPLATGTTVLNPQMRYLINIGSVGQPRDGDKKAKYVIWDSTLGAIELRRVAYDNAGAAAKIIAAGLPRAYADRLIAMV